MSYDEFIGREYEPFSIEVEKGRLRLFAKAAGIEDPVYTDEEAAREAGYPALPAPPTFAYSVTMDAGQSFNVLVDMGVDLSRAVHGGQSFRYHKAICAGDVISGHQVIKNISEKKGGALLFIETEFQLSNQNGDVVSDLNSTIIVRNG